MKYMYITLVWGSTILTKIRQNWQNIEHNKVTFKINKRTTVALQAEGWVFESQPRQTKVVKTGSDSSTVKLSSIGVRVTVPRRWPLYTDAPCYSIRGTLKNPHCLMTMSAEQRSKFAALYRNGDFSILVKNSRLGR